MLTLRRTRALLWLRRCWALLHCPLLSADPHIPLSIFQSEPLQVARLTWPVWGYPHAETPASEVRGHLSWFFKCPTSLHLGRLSDQWCILLGPSEVTWNPPFLCCAPVGYGGQAATRGEKLPTVHSLHLVKFACYFSAGDSLPQIQL